MSVALIFATCFGIAVLKIRNNKGLQVDLRDKLLLSLGFFDSFFVFLYHLIFFQNQILFA
jgi:hypothetical protein